MSDQEAKFYFYQEDESFWARSKVVGNDDSEGVMIAVGDNLLELMDDCTSAVECTNDGEFQDYQHQSRTKSL